MTHWDVLGGLDEALRDHARLIGRPRVRMASRRQTPGIPRSLFERLYDNPDNAVIRATDEELSYIWAARDIG